MKWLILHYLFLQSPQGMVIKSYSWCNQDLPKALLNKVLAAFGETCTCQVLCYKQENHTFIYLLCIFYLLQAVLQCLSHLRLLPLGINPQLWRGSSVAHQWHWACHQAFSMKLCIQRKSQTAYSLPAVQCPSTECCMT